MRLCVAAGVVWMAIAAVATADDMLASISKPTVVSITSALPPSSEKDGQESEETDEPDEPSSYTAQGVRSEAVFEPAPLPQVTIDAERPALRKRIAHFVKTMTTQVSSYESLPRWGVKVCPAVTGLPAPQGEFILQRISSIARWAGIPLGAEDCKPNLWIAVTFEPSRLAKQMWSHDPGRFVDLSGRPATATEMRRFLDDPRPVRVWHGADLLGAMGNELGPYEDMPQQARAPKVNTLPTMSRIQIDDLQVIKSTLVVVDKRRVVGLKIGAVADYVAMVGLAAVNPDGDYASAESILNLFTASQKGQSIDQLSAWDARFLKALYATDQSSKLQLAVIVEKMTRDPGTTPLTPGAVPEVLITGERPGPGMWRVSKGDHTLWILATLVPLPRKMTWRSHAVETRIANSGVVLAPPEIVADVGFFSDPIYAHAIAQAERNPQGGTLKLVLSPELYARWQTLRARYMGGYDEHARPILAARDLFQQVIDLSGLTMHGTVWKTVVRIAHRKHVKILPVVIELKMDSPDDWIREFTQIPNDQEVTCLEKTIERIETDLEPMRRRANLWSLGDVNGLLALTFPDDRVACFNALFSVPRLHDQLEDAGVPLENEWLAAADSALSGNESSFAVVPISQLLKPDGWLAKLRARGYSVQDPDGRD